MGDGAGPSQQAAQPRPASRTALGAEPQFLVTLGVFTWERGLPFGGRLLPLDAHRWAFPAFWEEEAGLP